MSATDSQSSRSAVPDSPAGWRAAISPYQHSDVLRSSWQLVNSIVPYTVLMWLAWEMVDISYWATLAISVVAAGFLIRIFIIAHDCGHGSFFKSRRANVFWGSITSAMALLPFHAWRYDHATHHAHSGDLDRRGVGDIKMMTVSEYLAASRWARFCYRVYRNPIVMFGVGPLFAFGINYRFWPRGASRETRASIIRTNIALAVAAVVISTTAGWQALLLVQLPVIMISGSVGIWLFYVQHQFDGVYWRRHDSWSYFDQALGGSSHYALPRLLQWFTGNIGLHHVHHLGARIPNYSLEKCHREVELFREVRPISLLESLKCLRYRLLDEETGRLVGFDRVRESGSPA